MKFENWFSRHSFNIILFVVAGGGLILLSTNMIPPPNDRLLSVAWNLGHIPVFFALSWLLLETPATRRYPRITLIAVGMILILVSFLIEYIQEYIGRSFSFEDIYRNCLGGLIAVLFHRTIAATSSAIKGFNRIVIIFLLALATAPLSIIVVDTIHAYRSFPILSNLETFFEKYRWRGAQVEIKKDSSGQNHVLSKQFTTEQYSSITLAHFPSNWKKYSCLEFTTISQLTQTPSLHLKIYDAAHVDRQYDYNDRFNLRLKIQPGRQQHAIDLNLVREAPHARLMNMSNVKGLSLFTHDASTNFVLEFDDFRLSNRLKCN